MTSLTKPALIGSALLELGLYWYVVAQFHAWILGVEAFVAAFLLNVIHVLVRKVVEKSTDGGKRP